MTAEDFVRSFRELKDDMLATAIALHLQKMGLNDGQALVFRQVLDQALTDTCYTLLLGLDGCCSIGSAEQQPFTVRAEDGSEVCLGDGQVEALAYRFFHENQ